MKTRQFKPVDIIHIKNFGLSVEETNNLTDTFERLIKNTLSSLISYAEINTGDFFLNDKPIYLIRFERLFNRRDMEQWKASFYNGNKLKLEILGQLKKGGR